MKNKKELKTRIYSFRITDREFQFLAKTSKNRKTKIPIILRELISNLN